MPITKAMNQNAKSNNYTMHAETVIHKDKCMQDKGKRENTKIYSGSLFLKSYVQFLCPSSKEIH